MIKTDADNNVVAVTLVEGRPVRLKGGMQYRWVPISVLRKLKDGRWLHVLRDHSRSSSGKRVVTSRYCYNYPVFKLMGISQEASEAGFDEIVTPSAAATYPLLDGYSYGFVPKPVLAALAFEEDRDRFLRKLFGKRCDDPEFYDYVMGAQISTLCVLYAVRKPGVSNRTLISYAKYQRGGVYPNYAYKRLRTFISKVTSDTMEAILGERVSKSYLANTIAAMSVNKYIRMVPRNSIENRTLGGACDDLRAELKKYADLETERFVRQKARQEQRREAKRTSIRNAVYSVLRDRMVFGEVVTKPEGAVTGVYGRAEFAVTVSDAPPFYLMVVSPHADSIKNVLEAAGAPWNIFAQVDTTPAVW